MVDAPPADAASIDAVIDAPPDAADAVLEAQDAEGAPLTSAAFGETGVGVRVTKSITLANTGSVTAGRLTLAITGAAAGDFEIDGTQTSCTNAALAPAETCTVVIAVEPTAAGLREATFGFSSTPGGTGTVALSALGVVSDLHFDPASVDFGTLEIGHPLGASRVVQLVNDGAVAAPLDSIVLTGAAFMQPSSTCGATLPAGASCDLVISTMPTTLGTVEGALTVTSGSDAVALPIEVTGARRVTVTKRGTGTGTVTSAPAGVSCGATCNALFTEAVTLTATASGDSTFIGWSGSCGEDPTCVVPADTSPATVEATFALSGASTLTIMFAGSAPGEVRVVRGGAELKLCTGTCTAGVNPGDVIDLEAISSVGVIGFTGCTSNGADRCRLTVPAGASVVTATFAAVAPRTVTWTRLLPAVVWLTGVDSNGDVIAATTTQLFKLSGINGATLWTQTSPSITSFDTGPGGTIYALENGALVKRDASGAVVWSRPIPSIIGSAGGSVVRRPLAVGADGAVAVSGNTGIARWDAAGTQTWAIARTFDTPGGIAIEPGGVVVVPETNIGTVHETHGFRFAAADGTRLADVPGAIGYGYEPGGIDIDATGQIATSYSSNGEILVQLGSNFGSTENLGASGVRHAFALGANRDAIIGYRKDQGFDLGWAVKRFSPMAVETLLATTRLIGSRGPLVSDVAGGFSGETIVAGSYQPFDGPAVGWVQLWAPVGP